MKKRKYPPKLPIQHYCDVCKITVNKLCVRVPECVYFCGECLPKDAENNNQ